MTKSVKRNRDRIRDGQLAPKPVKKAQTLAEALEGLDLNDRTKTLLARAEETKAAEVTPEAAAEAETDTETVFNTPGTDANINPDNVAHEVVASTPLGQLGQSMRDHLQEQGNLSKA